MWIFIVIGIVVALMTFVKIMDIIKERKNYRLTQMNFMGRMKAKRIELKTFNREQQNQ
jgi:hypothetical protein